MSNILLIAAPGAGKGIISDHLKEKYNYVHLSIGNLIRKEALTNKKLSKELSKGKLVSDELVSKLFDDFLNEKKDNLIIDGFPRKMTQVNDFESIIEKHHLNIDKVIIIDIDKDIAIKRITGRKICEKCDHTFNIYVDNVSDTCPVCNSKLVTREDDNIDTYMKRYNIFIKETLPVIEYFKKNYKFYEIENDSDISDFYKKIDYIMKEDDVYDNN